MIKKDDMANALFFVVACSVCYVLLSYVLEKDEEN